MGAVAGPLVAAGFVTPVNRATGTTPASTALNALQGDNGPAPLLSQRGLTTVARPPLANSAVNSFVSVHVGSLGNFSALELRSPFVLPSQQLGINYSTSLKLATGNMGSAPLNPQIIDNYLQLEVQAGRLAGPFSQPPLPVLHVSPFGVIPKHRQHGKWRLILDLSSPVGHSVNDGIAGEDYSLQYMKVDDIIAGIMRLGRGSLMAKFDVQNAYRIVPVHTEDRQLLGMKWRGAFYVDMVLPFGVRSAPYIFTCIAD